MENLDRKICTLCGKDKFVVHKDSVCTNCYRKHINPNIYEKLKANNKKRRSSLTSKFNHGKAEAKHRKIKWGLTKEEYEEFNTKLCFYCGGSLPTKGVGLDRISNDKNIGYIKENVIPCCTVCNSVRGDKLTVGETIYAVQAIREKRELQLNRLFESDVDLDTRVIFLYGEIDRDSTLKFEKNMDILEGVNPYLNIDIMVMSEGGNWFDALSIFDRIKRSKCFVRIIGTGLVASSATVIFQAASERIITPNCIFLVHDGTESYDGDAKSFESWGELSKKSRQKMYEIYSKASGKSIDFWKTECTKDTLYFGQEIIDAGLADKVLK